MLFFDEIVQSKLTDLLKMYLYLRGMPEVVGSYLVNKNIEEVRVLQKEILQAYERDFSKYTTKGQAIKTMEFWNAIPGQLAKENKKFKYAEMRKGARSAMFEQTTEWLRGAGLINMVYNLTTPKKPVSAYTDYSKFKVDRHDVGLLGAMLNITSDLIIEPDQLFNEFCQVVKVRESKCKPAASDLLPGTPPFEISDPGEGSLEASSFNHACFG